MRLLLPERRRRIDLQGAQFVVDDAAFAQRFVRRLRILAASETVDIITPPELGSIAPRAAWLPLVSESAWIVDVPAWETAVKWVKEEGRLGAYTIGDLAQLACWATSAFAYSIGEKAGQLADEMTWNGRGPMRVRSLPGDDIQSFLRPLEHAAQHSERAREAFVAALSCCYVAAQ